MSLAKRVYETSPFTIRDNVQGSYAPDSSCSWLVAPTFDENNVQTHFDSIWLSFTTVELNDESDIIVVYDGDTDAASELVRIAGPLEIPPDDVKSTTGKVFITFTSDSVGHAGGFTTKWKAGKSSSASARIKCNILTQRIALLIAAAKGHAPMDIVSAMKDGKAMPAMSQQDGIVSEAITTQGMAAIVVVGYMTLIVGIFRPMYWNAKRPRCFHLLESSSIQPKVNFLQVYACIVPFLIQFLRCEPNPTRNGTPRMEYCRKHVP